MSSDLRVTKSRKLLLEVLEREKRPLSVPELTAVLKVNKTTVYRELQTLLKHAVVTEVEFGDGKKRYELTGVHHHHLICVKCKSVLDVLVDEGLEKQEQEIQKKNHFTSIRHSLEFFGVCSHCA